MNYTSALDRLLTLTDYERMTVTTPRRVRYDLSRMAALLARLGNPHQGIPAVHITGTKGKGSTAALCSSVLSAQGYRTGLFTSPHLHTFRERLQIDGQPISEEEFAGLVEELWPHVEAMALERTHGNVTVFELLTAMAFMWFQQRKVQFQVLEVGMGGRLDTTNLVTPEVSVITPVSLDHTAILGDTVQKIAVEKAGIIKPGVPVVSAPQAPEAMAVIRETSQTRGSPLVEVEREYRWEPVSHTLSGQYFRLSHNGHSRRMWTPLLGEYQMENATTAYAAIEVLRERGFPVSQKAIALGFQRTRWPCRLEVLETTPLVVADGAHNPFSVSRLCQSLPKYFDYQRVVLVVGAGAGHDHLGIVEGLASLQPVVVAVSSRHPRALPIASIQEAFSRHGIQAVAGGTVAQGLALAKEQAQKGDLILVTGSLFVAAEAREAVKGIQPELYPQLQKGSVVPLRAV